MRVEIGVEEWIQELARLSTQEEHTVVALTPDDIDNALGCSRMKTRKIIKAALASGQWECVQVLRKSYDGIPRPISAFRLKAAVHA
jgi:hypothetical protein